MYNILYKTEKLVKMYKNSERGVNMHFLHIYKSAQQKSSPKVPEFCSADSTAEESPNPSGLAF